MIFGAHKQEKLAEGTSTERLTQKMMCHTAVWLGILSIAYWHLGIVLLGGAGLYYLFYRKTPHIPRCPPG